MDGIAVSVFKYLSSLCVLDVSPLSCILQFAHLLCYVKAF